MDARLDKYFFQNLVKYNEQPYGELVAANFFELDFSPKGVNHHGTFDTLREKIVLDLTVKGITSSAIKCNNSVSHSYLSWIDSSCKYCFTRGTADIIDAEAI